MAPLHLRDEVWKFDTETQTWSTMVDIKLSDPIYYHAVNIADFCPGECMRTCKQCLTRFGMERTNIFTGLLTKQL